MAKSPVAALIFHLDLGQALNLVVIAAGLAAVFLLIVYAVASLRSFIKIGTADAPDVLATPFSSELVAATIIAAASRDTPLTHAKITELMHKLGTPTTPKTPEQHHAAKAARRRRFADPMLLLPLSRRAALP